MPIPLFLGIAAWAQDPPESPGAAPDAPAAIPAPDPVPVEDAPTDVSDTPEASPEAAPAPEPAPPPPAPPDPAPVASAPTQSFPGLMNPSISFNGLFLAGLQLDDGTDLGDPHLGGEAGEAVGPAFGETYGTGLNVQEMELQIQSKVDPYFDAVVVLAMPGLEGLEIEEGYVRLLSIPRFTLTVGKLKEPFGRENPTHTHALLTVDKSLVGQRVFGGEGLNDVVVQGALLVPLPWFSEISVGVDSGRNEVLYGSGVPEGVGSLVHLKNLVDLSYATSLELGLSGATGLDAFDGRSSVGGVDLTVKSHGRGRRQWRKIVWQSEALYAVRENADVDEKIGGLYSTLEGAFARCWWVGGRFDWVGLPPDPDLGTTVAGTAIVVLAPTEFSSFRLQGQHQVALDSGRSVDSLVGQLDFTIGVHPAHGY